MNFYIRFMHALVIGSTGEIGKQLIPILANRSDIDKVTALTRNSVDSDMGKLHQLVIDFNDMASINIPKVDVAFCCLGTTMKKAGSKEAFERVDLDYVIDFAHLAYSLGTKQFHVISASGADKTSFFFYNRVKGQMEEELRKVGFQTTYVYRPALLDSERIEKRLGERVAIYVFRLLNPILVGSLKKFASITVKRVAQGMAQRIGQPKTGYYIIASDQI